MRVVLPSEGKPLPKADAVRAAIEKTKPITQVFSVPERSTPSDVSAQLCPPPKMLRVTPLMLIYKKVFDVMLHLEGEWPSKQNTLIADIILAESGL